MAMKNRVMTAALGVVITACANLPDSTTQPTSAGGTSTESSAVESGPEPQTVGRDTLASGTVAAPVTPQTGGDASSSAPPSPAEDTASGEPEQSPSLSKTPEGRSSPATPEMSPSGPETASEPASVAAEKSQPPLEKPTVSGPKAIEPDDPNTFLVTAGRKTERHPYFKNGHDMGFLVNGEPGKTLVLERGKKYRFRVDTGIQHDFYFTTVPKGWGAGTVSDGVKGQFTYKGDVFFAPTTTTPKVVFYQCRNHQYMGGKILVVDPGTTVSQDELEKVIFDKTSQKVKIAVTPQQVKQKISYAQMLMASESAQRVSASDHAEAKNLLAQAKERLAAARKSLQADHIDNAARQADEALQKINAATVLVPAQAVDVDYKEKYDHLLAEVSTYRKSYEKHAKRQKKSSVVKLDNNKLQVLLDSAAKAAENQDYRAGVENLTQAAAMLTAVLQVMLDDTTVVYDKNFATPKEEYEYELARYHSYVELIPIAIEQKQPSETVIEQMKQLQKKAERISNEGQGLADRGQYSTAIQALQAATDNLKRALMFAGVR